MGNRFPKANSGPWRDQNARSLTKRESNTTVVHMQRARLVPGLSLTVGLESVSSHELRSDISVGSLFWVLYL